MDIRAKHYILGFLFLSLLFYLWILTSPGPLFKYKKSYRYFVVYSPEPLPNKLIGLLDEVNTRLERSEVFSPSTQIHIFLCNNYDLYSFLSYPSKSTFAGYNFLTQNLIVAKADLLKNKAYRTKDNFERSFTNLITHETVHHLLRQHYGFLNYLTLKTWINEGYADYISGGGTRSQSKELQQFCKGENPKAYFNYRFAMQLLLEERGLSILDIVNDDSLNLKNLNAIIRSKNCSLNLNS